MSIGRISGPEFHNRSAKILFFWLTPLTRRRCRLTFAPVFMCTSKGLLVSALKNRSDAAIESASPVPSKESPSASAWAVVSGMSGKGTTVQRIAHLSDSFGFIFSCGLTQRL